MRLSECALHLRVFPLILLTIILPIALNSFDVVAAGASEAGPPGASSNGASGAGAAGPGAVGAGDDRCDADPGGGVEDDSATSAKSASASASARRQPTAFFCHGGGPLPLLGDPGHRMLVRRYRGRIMLALPTDLRLPSEAESRTYTHTHTHTFPHPTHGRLRALLRSLLASL
jgi:hypothetical protein